MLRKKEYCSVRDSLLINFYQTKEVEELTNDQKEENVIKDIISINNNMEELDDVLDVLDLKPSNPLDVEKALNLEKENLVQEKKPKKKQRLETKVTDLENCLEFIKDLEKKISNFFENYQPKLIEINAKSKEKEKEKIKTLQIQTLEKKYFDACQLPESQEKYLNMIISFGELLKINSKTIKTTNIHYVIQQELENAVENLKKFEEGEINFGPIEESLQVSNYGQISIRAGNILKTIQPFDTLKMKYFLDKAKENEKEVEGKEIIIFVGPSGSGKSTTIHYLAGSKMERVFGETHIHPVEVLDQYKNHLSSVVPSQSTKSETKFIAAVPILFNNRSVILCDSPGFDDTEGPEVDVSGSIGLIRAIKKAKAVKTVVIFSARQIGTRSHYIKSLAEIMTNLIPSIQDHLPSITVAFTGIEGNLSEVHRMISDVLSNLTETEISNDSFVKFLEFLSKKSDPKKLNQILIIDPLVEEEREEVLERIISRESIMYPDEIFRSTCTEKSKLAVRSQVQQIDKNIIQLLKKHDYPLIAHKLNELKILGDVFEKDYFEELQIKQSISLHLAKILSKAKLFLSDYSENLLKEQCFQSFKELYSHVEDAQILKEFIGDEIIHQNLLDEIVENNMKNLVDKMNAMDIFLTKDFHIFKIMLFNLGCFARHFESCFDSFKTVLCEITKKITLVLSICLKSLENDKFDIYKTVANLQNFLKDLPNFITDSKNSNFIQDWNAKVEEFNQLVIRFYQKKIQMLEKALENDSVSSELETISSVYHTFAEMKENKMLLKEVFENIDFEGFFAQSLNLLIEKCKKIQNEISDSIEENFESNHEIIHQRLEELSLFDNFKEIRSEIDKNKTMTQIWTKMEGNRSDLSNFLASTDDPTFTINFEFVSSRYKTIKNYSWIEKYENSFVTGELLNQIHSYIHFVYDFEISSLKEKSFDIDTSNFDLIPKIKNLYLSNQKVDPIFLQISQLKEKSIEVHSLYYNGLQEVLKKIEAIFDEVHPEFSTIDDCLEYLNIGKTKDLDNSKKIDRILNKGFEKIEIEKFNVKEEIICNIDKIYSGSFEDFSSIKKTIVLLYKKLALVKQFINIHEKFNVEEIKSEIKDYLSNQIYNDLFIKLNSFSNALIAEDQMEYRKTISIAHNLSAFDNLILNESKFSTLWTSENNLYFQQNNNLLDEIKKGINKHDYDGISTTLGSWKDDKTHLKSYRLITDYLWKKLSIFLEEAKTRLILISKVFKEEEFKQTVDDLTKIDNARKFVSSYLKKENQEVLESNFLEMKFNAQEMVHQLCGSASKQISSNKFKLAEETIYMISKCLLLLSRGYSDKSLHEALDQLKEIQQVKIKKKVESFKNISIEDYPQACPKEFLKNLNDCSFNEVAQDLISHITTKIREEINAPDSSLIKSRKLKKIERIIESTIGREDWTLNLYLEIEAEQLNLEEEEEFNQVEINRAVEYLEFEKMKEKLSESQSKKDKKNEMKIKESISSCMILAESNFLKLIKNEGNLRFESLKGEIRNQITNIMKLNTLFAESNPSLSSSFEFVKNESILFVNKTFKDILEVLNINKTPNSIIVNNFIYQLKVSGLLLEEKIVTTESTIFPVERKKIVSIFNNMKNDCKSDDLTKAVVNLSSLRQWNDLIIILDPTFTQFDALAHDILLEIEKTKILFENIVIVNLTTKENEKKRINYFQEKVTNLSFLKMATKIKNVVDPDNKCEIDKIFENCQSFLQEKIDQSVQLTLQKDITNSKLHMINNVYNSLSTIEEVFKEFKIDAKLDHFDLYLETQIDHFVDEARKNIKTSDKLAHYLIKLQEIGSNIGFYNEKVEEKIGEILCSLKKTDNAQLVLQLSSELNSDPNGVIIVESFPLFKSIVNQLFNESVKPLDYVVDNLEFEGYALKTDILLKRCKDFDEYYNKDVKNYIHKKSDLSQLISTIFHEVAQTKKDFNGWNKKIKDSIPKLMAHLFTLWTLKDAESMEENTAMDKKYLKKPHAGQIISIFLILGIGVEEKGDQGGSANKGLKNHFVQIGTGEGKSVTLAITSAILALFGYEVCCCCYSNYLSNRDYNDFSFLFDALNITRQIKYGTFNSLFEDLINEDGNIRTIIQDLIMNDKTEIIKAIRPKYNGKILLIDEVDKFFSTDFYSQLYNPNAKLKDPLITEFIHYLWEFNKQNPIYNKKTFETVQQSKEYIQLITKFKKWSYIFNEEIKNMFASIKNYEQHSYEVKDEKIGYIDQDEIVFNINCGYQTLFAYFNEFEKGNVTKQNLENNIYMTVKCGSFAYAEIPNLFDVIYGVSGTLRTLVDCKLQRKVVEEQFNISKFSFTPSVFGSNNLLFPEDKVTKIENISDYHIKIKEDIENNLIGDAERAVLVFFENTEKLHKFLDSEAFSLRKDTALIFTEGLNNKEKKTKIGNSTLSGSVSLLTASYGRGTDFICRDKRVKKNHGVHVIQTYLSGDLSEEIQIKGRTARQGEYGSYSMVLLDSELEKYLIFEEDIKKMRSKGEFYNVLNQKRKKLYEENYNSSYGSLDYLKSEHKKSLLFKDALFDNKISSINKYLKSKNVGANLESTSKTICLMDATYSMSNLLQGAKNTVNKMFQRAREVLREHGLKENCFELQFCVYRNYNCDEKKLFECSPFESNPDNLRNFMVPIGPDGGWVNEAIEIGLNHVVKTMKTETIDQVILIGDAPPNTRNDVASKRNSFGQNYWKTTNYSQAVYWEDELKNIKIPIHSFYIDERAKTSFETISSRTNGNSMFLDINSEKGSEILLNCVTLELLKIQQGGENLAQTYVKKYMEKI
jgi:hypothetical protein